MGDCLRTGKPTWYITNSNVNSAFHPYEVGKSTGLPGWGYSGTRSFVSSGRQHCVIPYGRWHSAMGFPLKAITNIFFW